MNYTTDQRHRGDRLHPTCSHSRYVILTALRREMERIVAEDLPPVEHMVVLDYGCGNMPYRPLFGSHTYIGADLPGNELATATIDATGRVHRADASCDAVVSTQALEHVHLPSAYLSECFRLLKPGGRLILSTHGYWIYHPDPNDYWRWTGEGLRKIVRDAGFEVRRVSALVGLPGAAVQLLQDAVAWRVPRPLRGAFSFVMQQMIRLVDRLFRRDEDNALVFVVIAAKPIATVPVSEPIGSVQT